MNGGFWTLGFWTLVGLAAACNGGLALMFLLEGRVPLGLLYIALSLSGLSVAWPRSPLFGAEGSETREHNVQRGTGSGKN